LVKVKGIGESVVKGILEYREQVGSFKSLKHFLETVPKKICNKKTVSNLIIAGAFDEIEDVQRESERLLLLFEFYEIMGYNHEENEIFSNPMNSKDYWWVLKQRELTGQGKINFSKLVSEADIKKSEKELYTTPLELESLKKHRTKMRVSVAGIVKEIVEFGKGKKKHLKYVLDNNGKTVECIVWESFVPKFNRVCDVGEVIIVTGENDIKGDRNAVMLNDRSKIYTI
jgi:DNA polymerase III alpha subunit